MKKKLAFICVHNSCRSQIAEALGKKFRSEDYDFYSAGTHPSSEINSDARRLVKSLYGIDMAETQYSKTLEELPEIHRVVTMGCGVTCPMIACKRREDWGLDDPSGKSDEAFTQVIKEIEARVKALD